MPNTVARNLRARRTDTIALVLPDMTNPFFTTLAQGVETAAREAGISLLLANSDEREDEERRLVPMLLQRQVDGLLIVPAGTGEETVRLCRDHGVPLVVVDRRPAGERRRTSSGPTPRAARSSSAGCSSAWAIATWPCCRARQPSPPRSTASPASAGRSWTRPACRQPLVVHGAFSIESGHAMATSAMARDAAARPPCSPPTTSSRSGSCTRSRSSASRVPDDVAVVGFDDLPRAMVTFPFLTVAAQPAFEMGRRAVAVLLERLANPARPRQDVVLPTGWSFAARAAARSSAPEPRADGMPCPVRSSWGRATRDTR